MSRSSYFTEDEALALVLAETEENFTGRNRAACAADHPDAPELSLSVDDDDDNVDAQHFLDVEFDVDAAAQQYGMLAVEEDHEDDGEIPAVMAMWKQKMSR